MGNKGNFDDDFNFDDDLFGNDADKLRGKASKGDDFDFGDDNSSFDSGDDFDRFDDLDNNDDFGDSGEEPARRSRVFVILAAIMVLFILLGLGGLIFFATRPTGPQPFDLTSTGIAQFNATQQVLLVETQTQSALFVAATETAVPLNATSTAQAQVAQTEQAILEVTQTQQAALALTEAAQPTASPTPTDSGAVVTGGTEVGPADATATSVAATATALSAGGIGPALTQTAIALTPGGGIATATSGGGLTANDVLLTATALAATLSPQTPTLGTGGIGDATRPPVFPTPTGQLPDTGLFDDISGVGSAGSMLLIAIGLLGVIVISRRLRRD